MLSLLYMPTSLSYMMIVRSLTRYSTGRNGHLVLRLLSPNILFRIPDVAAMAHHSDVVAILIIGISHRGATQG